MGGGAPPRAAGRVVINSGRYSVVNISLGPRDIEGYGGMIPRKTPKVCHFLEKFYLFLLFKKEIHFLLKDLFLSQLEHGTKGVKGKSPGSGRSSPVTRRHAVSGMLIRTYIDSAQVILFKPLSDS